MHLENVFIFFKLKDAVIETGRHRDLPSETPKCPGLGQAEARSPASSWVSHTDGRDSSICAIICCLPGEAVAANRTGIVEQSRLEPGTVTGMLASRAMV